MVSKKYLELIGGVDEKGKISKESQALLKALEASQQSYNEKMKTISSLNETEQSVSVFGDRAELTHSGVASVTTGASGCAVVRLVRDADAETSSVNALADRAVDGIISARGPVGWYSLPSRYIGPGVGEGSGLDGEPVEAYGDVNSVENTYRPQGQAGQSVMDTASALGSNEKGVLAKKVAEVGA